MMNVPDWIKEEIRYFLQTSWPMIAVPTLTDLPLLICSIIIGQSDLSSQAAFSLISAFFCIVYVFGIGMSMGVEGLFSQAYGARNYRYLRLLLQRGMFILACTGILMFPLNFTSAKIFVALGQNRNTSEKAGTMLMLLSPNNVFVFTTDILTRFLMAQDIVFPVVIISITVNVVSAVTCYVITIVLKMGTTGVTVALLVYFFLAMLAMGVLAMVRNKDVTPLYRLDAGLFRNLWEIISMAAGSTISVLNISLTLTIGAILTGTFGSVELVSLNATLQLILFVSNILMGISETCCIRVGFLLSSRDGKSAKRALMLYQTISLIAALLCGVVICSFHSYLARAFSSNILVQNKLKFMLVYLGASLPLLSVDVVFHAGIRGCAKIALLSVTCVISFFIGLGIGLTLLYCTPLGGLGIVVGYQSSSVINSLVFVPYALCILDWEEQSGLARERTRYDKKIVHENGESGYNTFNGD